MDERIDIVDDNDNVIGNELKSVCHLNKILHRGSNIFIFKDETFKEILIQKRSSIKMTNPSKLCTPGGHVGTGETYLDAAKREFLEEQFNVFDDISDYEDLVFEELFKVRKDCDNDFEFINNFRIVHSGPFDPDPNEVQFVFFEKLDFVLEDIKNSPENYTKTAILLLTEYKNRYVKS